MCAYLDSAPAGRIRVRDLAKLAGVSETQFAHAFRAEVDASPIAYLNRARATRAASLLRSGMPPPQVAAAVGFYDESHLHRYFKRLTGTTPARYSKAQAGRSHPGEDQQGQKHSPG